eukprot:15470797-Alexandrium_andersonii.AAC.1
MLRTRQVTAPSSTHRNKGSLAYRPRRYGRGFLSSGAPGARSSLTAAPLGATVCMRRKLMCPPRAARVRTVALVLRPPA